MSEEESPWYDVRPSADKGLGAFASKDIPSGTLILAEPYTITLTINELSISEADIESVLPTLSPTQREAFLALSDPPLQYSSKLVRTFLGNSISPSALPGSTCLCLKVARFNHSCLPNAEASWNGFTNTFDLYAICDIKADEEIMWSYITGSSCVPRSYRQFLQFMNWRFQCACGACQPRTEEDGLRSDARRERMYLLRKKLHDFEIGRLGMGSVEQRGIPLETWKSGELEKVLEALWLPPLELPDDLNDPNMQSQVSAWEELTKLMLEEGLAGKELAITYLNLVETALKQARMSPEELIRTNEWAKEAIRLISVSRPLNGPDVQVFQQRSIEWARQAKVHRRLNMQNGQPI